MCVSFRGFLREISQGILLYVWYCRGRHCFTNLLKQLLAIDLLCFGF